MTAIPHGNYTAPLPDVPYNVFIVKSCGPAQHICKGGTS